MKVADLDLIEPALSAAQAVEDAFPDAVFTSGRRTAPDQARAMAQNIVNRRSWITRTYRPTASSAALQAWVSDHPEADQAEIEAGLLAIMETWDDHQKRELSQHFAGTAFDVQPCDDEALLAHLEAMPGMKFLSQEGGLTRWHAQAI